jgi:hypothetical protein
VNKRIRQQNNIGTPTSVNGTDYSRGVRYAITILLVIIGGKEILNDLQLYSKDIRNARDLSGVFSDILLDKHLNMVYTLSIRNLNWRYENDSQTANQKAKRNESRANSSNSY